MLVRSVRRKRGGWERKGEKGREKRDTEGERGREGGMERRLNMRANWKPN